MSRPLFSFVAWTNSYTEVLRGIIACTRQAMNLKNHPSDRSLSREKVILGQLIARCNSVHTAPSHPKSVLEANKFLTLS